MDFRDMQLSFSMDKLVSNLKLLGSRSVLSSSEYKPDLHIPKYIKWIFKWLQRDLNPQPLSS